VTDDLRLTTRRTAPLDSVVRLVDLLRLLTGEVHSLTPDVDSAGTPRRPATDDVQRLVRWRGEWSPLLHFARRAIEADGVVPDFRSVGLLARRVAETVASFYPDADRQSDVFDQMLILAGHAPSLLPPDRVLTDSERARGADPQRRYRTPFRDTLGGLLGVDAAFIEWVRNNAPDDVDTVAGKMQRLTDPGKSETRRTLVIEDWTPRLVLTLTADDDAAVAGALQGVTTTKTNKRGTHLDLAFPDWLRVDNDGRVLVVTAPPGLSPATLAKALKGWSSPRLETLSRLVWSTAVKSELRRFKKIRPAVMVRHKTGVDDVLTTDPDDYLDRQTTLTDDGVVIVSKERGRLGRFAVPASDAAVLDVIRAGLSSLATPDGHRLRRGLTRLVHNRSQTLDRDDLIDARVVTFAGLVELAEAFGLSDPRDARTTLEMLVAGDALRTWRYGDRIAGGRLWSLSWSQLDPSTGAVKRGRPAAGTRLEMQVGTLLVPTRDDLTNANDKGRYLVPDLRHDVPVGRLSKDLHGAVWTLASRFVALQVQRGEQVAQGKGAIVLPVEPRRGVVGSWQRLIEQSSAVPSVVAELWSQRDRVLGTLADGPTPLLKSADGVDRWSLADCHDVERDFIIEGGQQRLDGTRRKARDRNKSKRKGS
jgi:hypothetical protein